MWIKRPEREADQSPLTSAEFKKTWDLYVHSPQLQLCLEAGTAVVRMLSTSAEIRSEDLLANAVREICRFVRAQF
jgi:hypothetical protein